MIRPVALSKARSILWSCCLAAAPAAACSSGGDDETPAVDASPGESADASAGEECPEDPVLGEAPVECIDWDDVAEARGFPTRPDDFFLFLQSGCFVEPTLASATLEELVDASSAIATGRLVDPVPVLLSGRGDTAEYDLRFRLDVETAVMGPMGTDLAISLGGCVTAGKIAGLLHTLPDERFLFFLEIHGDDQLYFPSFFYLGIVRDGADGPSFAIGPQAEILPPPLDEYGSIDELVLAVGEL